jgi:hypothetical protein
MLLLECKCLAALVLKILDFNRLIGYSENAIATHQDFAYCNVVMT